ncbi:hypothetical protein INR49_002746 [Caranx melampygus]|nr:hypothetical protein INR49_002746 [Caranx melampygus]
MSPTRTHFGEAQRDSEAVERWDARKMWLQKVLLPLLKLYLCGFKVLVYQMFNRSFTLPAGNEREEGRAAAKKIHEEGCTGKCNSLLRGSGPEASPPCPCQQRRDDAGSRVADGGRLRVPLRSELPGPLPADQPAAGHHEEVGTVDGCSRIVNMSSATHYAGVMDMEDLNRRKATVPTVPMLKANWVWSSSPNTCRSSWPPVAFTCRSTLWTPAWWTRPCITTCGPCTGTEEAGGQDAVQDSSRGSFHRHLRRGRLGDGGSRGLLPVQRPEDQILGLLLRFGAPGPAVEEELRACGPLGGLTPLRHMLYRESPHFIPFQHSLIQISRSSTVGLLCFSQEQKPKSFFGNKRCKV